MASTKSLLDYHKPPKPLRLAIQTTTTFTDSHHIRVDGRILAGNGGDHGSGCGGGSSVDDCNSISEKYSIYFDV